MVIISHPPSKYRAHISELVMSELEKEILGNVVLTYMSGHFNIIPMSFSI